MVSIDASLVFRVINIVAAAFIIIGGVATIIKGSFECPWFSLDQQNSCNWCTAILQEVINKDIA